MTEILHITLRGETFPLDLGSLRARDGAEVRNATREAGIGAMSLKGVIEAMQLSEINDLDLLAVVWWLARRQSGIQEHLSTVLDTFPTYGEMLTDPITVVAVDPDAPAVPEPDPTFRPPSIAGEVLTAHEETIDSPFV